MAWTVDDIFLLTKFLTRKNTSGGISATDLFYAWNSEQNAYMSDLLGRWQGRNNGRSAEIGLQETQAIMTKLNPFLFPITLTVASGIATKPPDFAYTIALLINGAQVFQVYPNQIASINENVIDPPSVSENDYYYTEYSNYYLILPSTVLSVDLDYISTPINVLWSGLPYDSLGLPSYNSGTSVQPQWNQLDIVEITKRTLKSFGVSFSSQDFENYGNSIIATGD